MVNILRYTVFIFKNNILYEDQGVIERDLILPAIRELKTLPIKTTTYCPTLIDVMLVQ